MKECFIIMPIATPAALLPEYNDDNDHFMHVLDHLFTSALETVGLTAIPPFSSGSKVIHGDIIENIENADLVLCDMSGLNPNVFFELGIRTALNKPACLVVDDVTEKKVPFDTDVINRHKYLSSLDPWILKDEVPQLADHVKSTLDQCEGKNAMWKYFGLSTVAASSTEEVESGERIDYLIRLVEAMRTELKTHLSPESTDPGKEVSGAESVATKIGGGWLNSRGINVLGWANDGPYLVITTDKPTSPGTKKFTEAYARSRGFLLTLSPAEPQG